MRGTLTVAWVCAVFCSVGGCVELTDPDPDANSQTAQLTVTISGLVTSEPLADVELCETDTNNCAMSDANGTVSITLPRGENVSYTVRKEDYAPYLIPHFVRSATSRYSLPMVPDGRAGELHALVMASYPLGVSATVRVVLEPTFAGATFELVGASGRAFYDDENDGWSGDLTATTVDGEGGFVDVSPGETTVRFGGTAEQCISDLAWPSTENNSVGVPVQEGHWTLVVVNCPRP